jgi:hypothetical protein
VANDRLPLLVEYRRLRRAGLLFPDVSFIAFGDVLDPDTAIPPADCAATARRASARLGVRPVARVRPKPPRDVVGQQLPPKGGDVVPMPVPAGWWLEPAAFLAVIASSGVIFWAIVAIVGN